MYANPASHRHQPASALDSDHAVDHQLTIVVSSITPARGTRGSTYARDAARRLSRRLCAGCRAIPSANNEFRHHDLGHTRPPSREPAPARTLIGAHAPIGEGKLLLALPAVRAMTAAGLLRLYATRSLGGSELERLELARVLEEIARIDDSTA